MFERRGIEMMIAQSYSKNFGLYGERIGALRYFPPPQTTYINQARRTRVHPSYNNKDRVYY